MFAAKAQCVCFADILLGNCRQLFGRKIYFYIMCGYGCGTTALPQSLHCRDSVAVTTVAEAVVTLAARQCMIQELDAHVGSAT